MAYYRRSRARTRRSYRSRGRSGYARRPVRRVSRRRSSGGRTARVVIQVVGGQGGVQASPASIGQKGGMFRRARY